MSNEIQTIFKGIYIQADRVEDALDVTIEEEFCSCSTVLSRSEAEELRDELTRMLKKDRSTPRADGLW